MRASFYEGARRFRTGTAPERRRPAATGVHAVNLVSSAPALESIPAS